MKYQIYEREDRLYVPVPTGLILVPWTGWLPERKPTMAEAYTESLFKARDETLFEVRERYLKMYVEPDPRVFLGTPA